MAAPTLVSFTCLEQLHPSASDAETTQSRLLFALCLGIFVTQLDARVIAPVLPGIANDLRLTLPQSAMLLTAYFLPYGFFQLVYGPLAGRFGKMRLVVAAMTVFSLATLFGSAWPSFSIMLFLRFLAGAAAACIYPMSVAYVGDTISYEKRQAALGLLISSSGTAVAFSLSLGGLIASLLSWHWIFPLLGLIALASTGLLALQIKNEIKLPKISLRESMYAYKKALSAPLVMPLLLLAALEGAIYLGSFSLWSEPLSRWHGLPSHWIGLILCMAGVLQLGTGYALRRYKGKLNEKQLVKAGGTCMSLAFLLLVLIDHWAVFIFSSALIGFAFVTCHTTLQIKATEVYAGNRSTTYGMFTLSLFLGSGIGSAVVGYLVTKLEFRPSMFILFLAAIAFSVLTLQYLKIFSREKA